MTNAPSFRAGLRIVQALPRGQTFRTGYATSVELCVAEWTSRSRHRATTTVVAERVPPGSAPLETVDVFRLPPARRLLSWHLALQLRRLAAARGADVIVVQQHLSTAAKIALFNLGRPVVLQTHNFLPGRATGRGAALRDASVSRQLRLLAGITFVSEATQDAFERDWPEVRVPRAIISSGFDFAGWSPARERARTVIVVGRAQVEKGIVEAAAGVAAFLADHPDWRAVFALSALNDDAYGRAVRAALSGMPRTDLRVGIPFPEVRRLTEEAGIAVVASLWDEPFGRTALEAHAGGVPLVSSGTGGLRGISGEFARYLDAVDGPSIARALADLAGDPDRRAALAAGAAERVHRLFPLATMSERLDAFLEGVASSRAWSR